MSKWFGADWGAIICKDSPHAATPVGTLCGHCSEPIRAGDFGVLMPVISILDVHDEAFHYECNLRMAVGSVGHQMRQCSCYGGKDDSEVNMSLREAAIHAARFFENFVKRP